MESNGKRVAANGTVLPYASGEFVFGEPGAKKRFIFTAKKRFHFHRRFLVCSTC